MDIDDQDAFETVPVDALMRVDEVLERFGGGDRSPVAFGDVGEAQAWLIHAQFFEELARARDWVDADEALSELPDDPATKGRYDAAAELAGNVDLPGPSHASLVSPEKFLAALPEYLMEVRSGTLRPVGIGRGGQAEAVLLGHDEYRALIQAQLRWRQSPPFLAKLDPAVHKPMAKSTPFNLEEHMSQNPVTREIWERIQQRKRSGGD